MIKIIKHIIKPESRVETEIVFDSAFIEGASYGKSRPGHPEGLVIYHIKEVLANIEKYYSKDEDRGKLRLIAMLHDTFKHKVNGNIPKTGDNHHGMIARNFAEKFSIPQDVLIVIALHDDAYNAWSSGNRRGDWNYAEKRANNLIRGLLIENCLDLYVKFYRCDNETGDKTQECLTWFNELL